MKPTPKGWPRLSTSAYYQDANVAIEWLCTAFGFEVRLKVDGEGGIVEHSELTFGDAVFMVGDERRQKDADRPFKSPKSIGGENTQSIMLYVDDVDAHYQRAVGAGARVIEPPKTTDYGDDYWADRSYGAFDLDGHLWWFCQRVRG